MSIAYNSSIVTSGLVLNVDARNVRSWPGSGTTWYDVSGQTNTEYMYGSVPTSSDGGGCFDFSTVTGGGSGSASLGFTFASNMIPTTGSFTLNCWVKNPPISAGQCGLFSNAGGGDGYRFGIGTDAIYYLIGPNYTEGGVGFTTALSSSTWHNVTAIYDRSGTNSAGTPQMQLYLNGVFQTTGYIPANQTAMQNSPPGLVRSACCGLYTGKVALFSAYSRALSAAEVSQNFTALRGRYGI